LIVNTAGKVAWLWLPRCAEGAIETVAYRSQTKVITDIRVAVQTFGRIAVREQRQHALDTDRAMEGIQDGTVVYREVAVVCLKKMNFQVAASFCRKQQPDGAVAGDCQSR